MSNVALRNFKNRSHQLVMCYAAIDRFIIHEHTSIFYHICVYSCFCCLASIMPTPMPMLLQSWIDFRWKIFKMKQTAIEYSRDQKFEPEIHWNTMQCWCGVCGKCGFNSRANRVPDQSWWNQAKSSWDKHVSIVRFLGFPNKIVFYLNIKLNDMVYNLNTGIWYWTWPRVYALS